MRYRLKHIYSRDLPTPWRVHHDEDVWILDAQGERVLVNIFDAETAQHVCDAVNAASELARERQAALEAERERCAKIALAAVSPKDGASKRDPIHAARVSTSDRIAAAIRAAAQSPGDPQQ